MTLADPGSQWKGFKPIAYWLDSEKVVSLPLIRVSDKEQLPTTIGEALEYLKSREIREAENSVFDAEVETDEGLPRLREFNSIGKCSCTC